MTNIILEEYCDTTSFIPTCPPNHLVIMRSAKYGRMRQGKCVEIDLGYLGCYSDVLDLTDRRCSGRRTCEIRVPDPDFESTKPCLKELKTYLEVGYECVQLSEEVPDDCAHLERVNITSPTGWLGSVITMETGCGSVIHPYFIHASSGQQINITLYDFWPEKLYGMKTIPDNSIDTHICKEYALIREHGTDWNSIVCGGSRRLQNVYVSKTNIVELQITNKDSRNFMLRYEAIGCPDLEPPAHGWFEREDSGALVGCKYSSMRWHITCTGTQWIGFVGNCSAPSVTPMEEHSAFDISLPLGASISIIIGAAVGVGLVVIVIGVFRFKGLFFFKRREYETPPGRETFMLVDKSPPPSESGQIIDSGHCSLETTETAVGMTTLPGQTPGGAAIMCTAGVTCPSATLPMASPGQQHRFLHHQRVVKINGNEYAHIWETPLPEPRNPQNPSCRLCPRDPRDPLSRNVNTVYMLRCAKPGEKPFCQTVHTLKPFRKETLQNAQNSSVCAASTSYESAPRYSSLERKGNYGNSSSSV